MADTGTNKPPFDLQGLNDLYGAETVSELLEMSVDEARALLAQMDVAISQHNSRGVMEAAHQLKGLAATMTINELASISLKIETSARSEQWNQLPELRRILGDEFEQVAAYIASVLKATP